MPLTARKAREIESLFAKHGHELYWTVTLGAYPNLTHLNPLPASREASNKWGYRADVLTQTGFPEGQVGASLSPFVAAAELAARAFFAECPPHLADDLRLAEVFDRSHEWIASDWADAWVWMVHSAAAAGLLRTVPRVTWAIYDQPPVAVRGTSTFLTPIGVPSQELWDLYLRRKAGLDVTVRQVQTAPGVFVLGELPRRIKEAIDAKMVVAETLPTPDVNRFHDRYSDDPRWKRDMINRWVSVGTVGQYAHREVEKQRRAERQHPDFPWRSWEVDFHQCEFEESPGATGVRLALPTLRWLQAIIDHEGAVDRSTARSVLWDEVTDTALGKRIHDVNHELKNAGLSKFILARSKGKWIYLKNYPTYSIDPSRFDDDEEYGQVYYDPDS